MVVLHLSKAFIQYVTLVIFYYMIEKAAFNMFKEHNLLKRYSKKHIEKIIWHR